MGASVVSGDYEGKPISTSCGVATIVLGFRPKNNINLTSEVVSKYEVVSEGEKKRAGRAVVGTILAGPLGLAVGALSAKTKGMLVAVEFKDGKKSLIECDKKTYEAIVKKCFSFEEGSSPS